MPSASVMVRVMATGADGAAGAGAEGRSRRGDTGREPIGPRKPPQIITPTGKTMSMQLAASEPGIFTGSADFLPHLIHFDFFAFEVFVD
jgi:hypothetical protein